MGVALSAVSGARAHPAHAGGGSVGTGLPVRIDGASRVGALRGVRTRIGLSVRYLRLPGIDEAAGEERDPTDGTTSTGGMGSSPTEHLIFHDLQASYAFGSELGLEVTLLIGVRMVEGRKRAGLGDVRLGIRFVPFMDRERKYAVGFGAETSFPTGDDEERLGTGEYISRISTSYSQVFGVERRWMLAASGGLSWTWDGGWNVVVDYGGNASYMPMKRLGVFADIRAQTFLRTTRNKLSAEQRFARRPGDTEVVLTPGLQVVPVDSLWVSLGPRFALTRVQTFDVGATLSVQYVFSR